MPVTLDDLLVRLATDKAFATAVHDSPAEVAARYGLSDADLATLSAVRVDKKARRPRRLEERLSRSAFVFGTEGMAGADADAGADEPEASSDDEGGGESAESSTSSDDSGNDDSGGEDSGGEDSGGEDSGGEDSGGESEGRDETGGDGSSDTDGRSAVAENSRAEDAGSEEDEEPEEPEETDEKDETDDTEHDPATRAERTEESTDDPQVGEGGHRVPAGSGAPPPGEGAHDADVPPPAPSSATDPWAPRVPAGAVNVETVQNADGSTTMTTWDAGGVRTVQEASFGPNGLRVLHTYDADGAAVSSQSWTPDGAPYHGQGGVTLAYGGQQETSADAATEDHDDVTGVLGTVVGTVDEYGHDPIGAGAESLLRIGDPGTVSSVGQPLVPAEQLTRLGQGDVVHRVGDPLTLDARPRPGGDVLLNPQPLPPRAVDVAALVRTMPGEPEATDRTSGVPGRSGAELPSTVAPAAEEGDEAGPPEDGTPADAAERAWEPTGQRFGENLLSILADRDEADPERVLDEVQRLVTQTVEHELQRALTTVLAVHGDQAPAWLAAAVGATTTSATAPTAAHALIGPEGPTTSSAPSSPTTTTTTVPPAGPAAPTGTSPGAPGLVVPASPAAPASPSPASPSPTGPTGPTGPTSPTTTTPTDPPPSAAPATSTGSAAPGVEPTGASGEPTTGTAAPGSDAASRVEETVNDDGSRTQRVVATDGTVQAEQTTSADGRSIVRQDFTTGELSTSHFDGTTSTSTVVEARGARIEEFVGTTHTTLEADPAGDFLARIERPETTRVEIVPVEHTDTVNGDGTTTRVFTWAHGQTDVVVFDTASGQVLDHGGSPPDPATATGTPVQVEWPDAQTHTVHLSPQADGTLGATYTDGTTTRTAVQHPDGSLDMVTRQVDASGAPVQETRVTVAPDGERTTRIFEPDGTLRSESTISADRLTETTRFASGDYLERHLDGDVVTSIGVEAGGEPVVVTTSTGEQSTLRPDPAGDFLARSESAEGQLTFTPVGHTDVVHDDGTTTRTYTFPTGRTDTVTSETATGRVLDHDTAPGLPGSAVGAQVLVDWPDGRSHVVHLIPQDGGSSGATYTDGLTTRTAIQHPDGSIDMRTVRVDPESGARLETTTIGATGEEITSSFNPDGSLSGTTRLTFPPGGGTVTEAFGPDGQLLVESTRSADGTVVVDRMATGAYVVTRLDGDAGSMTSVEPGASSLTTTTAAATATIGTETAVQPDPAGDFTARTTSAEGLVTIVPVEHIDSDNGDGTTTRAFVHADGKVERVQFDTASGRVLDIQIEPAGEGAVRGTQVVVDWPGGPTQVVHLLPRPDGDLGLTYTDGDVVRTVVQDAATGEIRQTATPAPPPIMAGEG